MMKAFVNPARQSVLAFFAALILTFVFGAQTSRAQDIRPYVDCVERERDASGNLTGKYIAYFGYINNGTATVFIPVNSAGNFIVPTRSPPNEPDTFQPGVHPRALAIVLDLSVSETWYLTSFSATATLGVNQICGNDGANSRLITYQGRLNDGNAAANGTYDLQFQLFDAASGGKARTTPILLQDETVVNGVFTVQLNLGANSIIYPNTLNGSGNTASNPPVSINLPLNPAIIEGTDGFLEIGVRPGTSTGAFTILAPRQPLTAVPSAMRANTANNAVRASFADQAKIPILAQQGNCSSASDYGRNYLNGTTLFVCTTTGWKSTTLQ